MKKLVRESLSSMNNLSEELGPNNIKFRDIKIGDKLSCYVYDDIEPQPPFGEGPENKFEVVVNDIIDGDMLVTVLDSLTIPHMDFVNKINFDTINSPEFYDKHSKLMDDLDENIIFWMYMEDIDRIETEFGTPIMILEKN